MYKYRIIFIIYTTIFNACWCIIDDCHNDLAESLNITFDTSTTFQLDDASDITKYSINVTFTWNINEDVEFDGFLYEIEDRDNVLNGVHKKSSLGTTFKRWGFKRIVPPCHKAKGEQIWISANDTEFQCDLPCSDYITGECVSDELCNLLNSKYIALPKTARHVTFSGKFGRRYDLKMKAYRGKKVGHYFEIEKHVYPSSDPVYCNNQLIEHNNIEKATANKFCQTEQKIADLVFASGPPASFEEVSINRNLEKNRGEVTFRWKSPYDISPRTTISTFDLYVSDGKLEETRIKALSKEADHFYNVTVEDVIFGKETDMSVTPTYTSNCLENGSLFPCVNHGVPRYFTFFIEDIDACSFNNTEQNYCDDVAFCEDLGPESSTAANCTCPDGYDGNGINKTYESGSGCYDHDSCSDINRSCVSEAICTDLPPPYTNATCECPSTHIGDGRIDGSGCTSLSLILGLAVGLPLVILTVLLLWLAAWRIKVTKKREIEMKLSKFIVAKEKNIMFTNGIENGHITNKIPSAGMFGEKWELDRNDLEFKDVIGRGNFGVVHRAILTTESGEKIVAVKTTPETPDESQKNGFLAEIALISTVGSHDNVMGMIGCCTASSSVCLITELMKYGDLLHFLWDAREELNRLRDPTYNLNELSIYQIGKQVAEGMEYLTNLKIIHGDVAARNILVGEDLRCKISDFGLANDVYRYGMIKGAWEKRVPFKWVSPERMMGGKVPITWRSDVWSFGVLLYEIVTLGASPYPGIPQEEIFQLLENGDRMSQPSTCNDVLYDIMLQCWQWTPSKRPTFKQLAKNMHTAMQNRDNFQNISSMISSLDIEAYQSEIACRNGVDSAPRFVALDPIDNDDVIHDVSFDADDEDDVNTGLV